MIMDSSPVAAEDLWPSGVPIRSIVEELHTPSRSSRRKLITSYLSLLPHDLIHEAFVLCSEFLKTSVHYIYLSSVLAGGAIFSYLQLFKIIEEWESPRALVSARSDSLPAKCVSINFLLYVCGHYESRTESRFNIDLHWLEMLMLAKRHFGRRLSYV